MTKWTKDQPTKTGFYWFRFDAEKFPDLPAEVAAPKMLYVAKDPDGFYVTDLAEPLCEYRLEVMHGQWQGPIVPAD